MSKLYIFDLDGTLANIEHRRYILENKNNSSRWDDFYNACWMDTPNQPVIDLFEMLLAAGHRVVIFSGRSNIVRLKTENWLIDNIKFPFNSKANIYEYFYSNLWMRASADYTPDEILKKQWLDMLLQDGDKVTAVFDDRDKVVKMWRDNNIPCFQVNYGNF